MEEKKRLSILKKSPAPTVTKSTRRISFSDTKCVKEFLTGEDKATIWGTSYEEVAHSLDSNKTPPENITIDTTLQPPTYKSTPLRNSVQSVVVDRPDRAVNGIANRDFSDSIEGSIINTAYSYDNRTFNATIEVPMNSYEIRNYKFARSSDETNSKEKRPVLQPITLHKNLPPPQDCPSINNSMVSHCSFIQDYERKLLRQTEPPVQSNKLKVSMNQSFAAESMRMKFTNLDMALDQETDETALNTTTLCTERMSLNPRPKLRERSKHSLATNEMDISLVANEAPLNVPNVQPIDLSQIENIDPDDMTFTRKGPHQLIRGSAIRKTICFNNGEAIDTNLKTENFQPKPLKNAPKSFTLPDSEMLIDRKLQRQAEPPAQSNKLKASMDQSFAAKSMRMKFTNLDMALDQETDETALNKTTLCTERMSLNPRRELRERPKHSLATNEMDISLVANEAQLNVPNVQPIDLSQIENIDPEDMTFIHKRPHQVIRDGAIRKTICFNNGEAIDTDLKTENFQPKPLKNAPESNILPASEMLIDRKLQRQVEPPAQSNKLKVFMDQSFAAESMRMKFTNLDMALDQKTDETALNKTTLCTERMSINPRRELRERPKQSLATNEMDISLVANEAPLNVPNVQPIDLSQIENIDSDDMTFIHTRPHQLMRDGAIRKTICFNNEEAIDRDSKTENFQPQPLKNALKSFTLPDSEMLIDRKLQRQAEPPAQSNKLKASMDQSFAAKSMRMKFTNLDMALDQETDQTVLNKTTLCTERMSLNPRRELRERPKHSLATNEMDISLVVNEAPLNVPNVQPIDLSQIENIDSDDMTFIHTRPHQLMRDGAIRKTICFNNEEAIDTDSKTENFQPKPLKNAPKSFTFPASEMLIEDLTKRPKQENILEVPKNRKTIVYSTGEEIEGTSSSQPLKKPNNLLYSEIDDTLRKEKKSLMKSTHMKIENLERKETTGKRKRQSVLVASDMEDIVYADARQQSMNNIPMAVATGNKSKRQTITTSSNMEETILSNFEQLPAILHTEHDSNIDLELLQDNDLQKSKVKNETRINQSEGAIDIFPLEENDLQQKDDGIDDESLNLDNVQSFQFSPGAYSVSCLKRASETQLRQNYEEMNLNLPAEKMNIDPVAVDFAQLHTKYGSEESSRAVTFNQSKVLDLPPHVAAKSTNEKVAIMSQEKKCRKTIFDTEMYIDESLLACGPSDPLPHTAEMPANSSIESSPSKQSINKVLFSPANISTTVYPTKLCSSANTNVTRKAAIRHNPLKKKHRSTLLLNESIDIDEACPSQESALASDENVKPYSHQLFRRTKTRKTIFLSEPIRDDDQNVLLEDSVDQLRDAKSDKTFFTKESIIGNASSTAIKCNNRSILLQETIADNDAREESSVQVVRDHVGLDKQFEENSETTDTESRLFRKNVRDSICFRQMAKSPTVVCSFPTTPSSTFSPNTTAALCNIDPNKITETGYRNHRGGSKSSNQDNDNTLYREFKRDYVNLTFDNTLKGCLEHSDDIHKTKIDLVESTLESVEEIAIEDICETSVRLLNRIEMNRGKGPVESNASRTFTAEEHRSLCKKCRNCQKPVFTMDDTTLTGFQLEPEDPDDLGLDFSRLQRFRGMPRMADVVNAFTEHLAMADFDLDSSVGNLSINESTMLPDIPSVEFLIDNYAKEHAKKLKGERENRGNVYAIYPLIPTFEILWKNYLDTEINNWNFNYFHLPFGSLECRHKKIRSLRLLVIFDSKDLYSSKSSTLKFTEVKLTECPQYKRMVHFIFDDILHNEVFLRVSRNHTAICRTSDELCKTLEKIHNAFEIAIKLKCELIKTVYLNGSRLEYDERGHCIVKKNVLLETEKLNEFRIRIRNIEKMCFNDVTFPASPCFDEDLVNRLPTGLDFLRTFLVDPVGYLK